MSKVLPKISSPGSAKFPTKGPHNPNVGTRGSGMAPKPSGGANIPGNDRPSLPSSGGIARAGTAGSSPTGRGNSAGSFTPPKTNAMAGLQGKAIGQREASMSGGARVSPQTKTSVTGNPVATQKPKRRGLGAAFYGEYK